MNYFSEKVAGKKKKKVCCFKVFPDLKVTVRKRGQIINTTKKN